LAVEFPNALLAGASYWDFAAEDTASILEGKLKRVGHACEFETSLMLRLRPDLVKTSEMADGGLNLDPVLLRNVFIPLDMKRQTPQGGTGQPTLATSQKGEKLLAAVVANGIKVIQTLRSQPIRP
ncbi:MAG: creatininase family protein, partial [Limisphaerales bacterium]